jgi:hypothetical protein
MLGVILILATLASGCWRGSAVCPACERAECRNMAFTIHLANGKSVRTCCPRCGLHYINLHHPKVASLEVREFETADSLDATRAFYVEGSDVTPCTSASPSDSTPKDERGCCLNPVYDRCLPSLLAFARKQDAEAFARQHGGTVREFGEIGAVKRAARG